MQTTRASSSSMRRRTGRQEGEKKIKVPRGVTTPQDHSKTQSSSTHPPFCTVSQTEPCLGNEMRRDEVRLNDRPDDLSQRMSLTQRINCVVRVLIQDSVAISRIHVNYNIGSSQVKQRISSKNFSKVNNNKSLLNRSITPHRTAPQSQTEMKTRIHNVQMIFVVPQRPFRSFFLPIQPYSLQPRSRRRLIASFSL